MCRHEVFSVWVCFTPCPESLEHTPAGSTGHGWYGVSANDNRECIRTRYTGNQESVELLELLLSLKILTPS